MKEDHPYYSNSMFKGAPPENFSKAEMLRKNMTEAEKVLWEKLKGGRMGEKFRRQHPLHLYIVDFYCHSKKLVIELDGEYHNSEEQKNRDKERTKILEFQDLEVIRFTNKEVLEDLENVLSKILEKLNSSSPTECK